MPLPAVGIFVGGRGLRMGGVQKGLLLHEGRPLVDHIIDACRRAAAPEPLAHVYLVGNAKAYGDIALPRLADDPPGVGPMGGMRALLLEARRLGLDAVALAVDQPYASAALLRRLYCEEAGAAALGPREGGLWQPLFARYRPELALPWIETALAARRGSLQLIFEGLASTEERPAELVVSDTERLTLRDWDRPSDMDGTVPDVDR